MYDAAHWRRASGGRESVPTRSFRQLPQHALPHRSEQSVIPDPYGGGCLREMGSFQLAIQGMRTAPAKCRPAVSDPPPAATARGRNQTACLR